MVRLRKLADWRGELPKLLREYAQRSLMSPLAHSLRALVYCAGEGVIEHRSPILARLTNAVIRLLCVAGDDLG